MKEERNDAERGKERGWTESDIWLLLGRLLRTARLSVLVSLSNIQKASYLEVRTLLMELIGSTYTACRKPKRKIKFQFDG